MQKDSVHPIGTEVHFTEQGSVGAGEFLGRNLRAVSGQGGADTVPLWF